MRAIWLADRRLEVRDVPVPVAPPGEALIRVLRAGICNTDVELVRGYYPYDGILGHEFVGVVEEGPEALTGKRVVGEINAVCGDCVACRGGRSSHCERRTVLGIVNRHGVFAEYATLPVENLHVVPEAVSTDAATFVEPLAAALRIQEQVEIGPAHRVLVVGDGKLGQLVATTLRLTGCDLTVVGRHDTKLRRLRDLGIATATDGEFSGPGFDVAVECTGNAAGFEVARGALRPMGTLVMKSTYADRLSFDASALVVDEITLVGSRCGPFGWALELLEQEQVEVESLVHARYPLADGLGAIEHAQRAGVLKVLLDIGAEDCAV